MISPTEFYKGLETGVYKTNVKIYQSRQTLDYNGRPMFEVDITTTKTRNPIKEDPYDAPYEFRLTMKKNQQEIDDFIMGVKLSGLRWRTAEEVNITISKLEKLLKSFVDACNSYQGDKYDSASDYYAYLTISSCYEYLSTYLDDLRYGYEVYITRT